MSIRDTALNAELESRIIDIPEWGAKVKVKAMSAAQRERFITNRAEGFMYTDIVIACTFDPDTDKPVFDPADRDTLAASPAQPLERVFTVVAEMSAIDDGAVDEAKERLKDDPFDGTS